MKEKKQEYGVYTFTNLKFLAPATKIRIRISMTPAHFRDILLNFVLCTGNYPSLVHYYLGNLAAYIIILLSHTVP